jgi:hypothetical protein
MTTEYAFGGVPDMFCRKAVNFEVAPVPAGAMFDTVTGPPDDGREDALKLPPPAAAGPSSVVSNGAA